MDREVIARLLGRTRVEVGPARLLSPFGPTRISYSVVSPVEDLVDRTRLRRGSVVSERPAILTPDALKERFEGFGEESAEFARWLCDRYRDALRSVEYTFRNMDLSTSVLHERPDAVSARIRAELEEKRPPNSVLMSCPDAGWSLALMKFALEESAKSFPSHVRAFERRGLFDPDSGLLRGRRAELESLFAKASFRPEARRELGAKLKEWGLFEEYEDRFLSLFS